MSTTYHPDVRVADLLGGPVRRLRGTPNHVLLDIDTEEHDLELLRSIANAVRTNAEAVDALVEYAEVRDAIDAAEAAARRNANHERALHDDAADALGEVSRLLDTEPGEPMQVFLTPGDVGRLRDGLDEWASTGRAVA